MTFIGFSFDSVALAARSLACPASKPGLSVGMLLNAGILDGRAILDATLGIPDA